MKGRIEDTSRPFDEVAWLRAALENLFDLDYLQRHLAINDQDNLGMFANASALQTRLLQMIPLLKPPANVSMRADAWRCYNILNLRYLQGLSQGEVALQLNLGVRQLRREQSRAIRAAAAALWPDYKADDHALITPNPSTYSSLFKAEPHTLQPELVEQKLIRLDEALQAALYVFEPLLDKQDVDVQVAIGQSLQPVRGNPLVVRQLLISALNWMIFGVTQAQTTVALVLEERNLVVTLQRPISLLTDARTQLEPVQSLADVTGARTTLKTSARHSQLGLHIPAIQNAAVLMVDDNADSVQLVARYLERSDAFYLVPLHKPSEVLRQAALLNPVCILLDVMMPERDGWEVLTLLKTHPETARIPVIISSVLNQPDLAVALGAAATLPKPFRAEQLLAALQRVTQVAQSAPTP